MIAACKSSDKNGGPGELTARQKDSLKVATNNKVLADSANYTTIQWLDSTFIAVGKVKEGKEVEVPFRFKNTGNKPLYFINVTPRCGCTVAEKPEEPIAPGGEGVIMGKFNSKGRPGSNRKQIDVQANAKPNGSFLLEFEVIVE